MPRSLKFVPLFLLGAGVSPAECRYYFADQLDFGRKLGFTLDVEAISNGSNPCQQSDLKLVFGVGDGTEIHWIIVKPSRWRVGALYEVRAIISPSGSQLYLDSELVGSAKGAFAPFDKPVEGALRPAWAASEANFTINQYSLEVSDGSSTLSLPPDEIRLVPTPVQLMSPPPAWRGPFPADRDRITTITAKFYVFPPWNPDLRQYDPYIDRYGQIRYSEWPAKIKSDDDLANAVAEERA